MSRDTTVEVLLVVLLVLVTHWRRRAEARRRERAEHYLYGMVSKTNGHVPTQPEEWVRDDAG
jgi:hypothetical protein